MKSLFGASKTLRLISSGKWAANSRQFSSDTIPQAFFRRFKEASQQFANLDHEQANKTLAELLEDSGEIQISEFYTKILKLQATNYYYMRRYKDAEVSFQNIEEIIKAGIPDGIFKQSHLINNMCDQSFLFGVSNPLRAIEILQDMRKKHYNDLKKEEAELMFFAIGVLEFVISC